MVGQRPVAVERDGHVGHPSAVGALGQDVGDRHRGAIAQGHAAVPDGRQQEHGGQRELL